MSEYGIQVNVKIGSRTKSALEQVAEFEDIKPSELVRNWIREKLAEYRKDRLYMKWLEKRENREKTKEKNWEE